MSEWGEDAVDATCGSCGNTRPCVHLPDPFLAEVYPGDPNEARWWCWACYDERLLEV